VFSRLKHKLRNLEPATIREIIVVLIILIISIALSIPEFRADMEDLRRWEQARESMESRENVETGIDNQRD
jgi:type II secretory pathway pseudopilin PulG